jgi:yecA family protein
MVTALQICPQVVMPTQLLEKIGGPGGRLWNDKEELQEFASLLMQYWNYVSDCVHDCRSPDATDQDHPVDIIAEDFPAGEQIGILSAIHEWVCGFMRATKEWPEAWGDALARPDLALHWELLQRWVDIQAEGNTEYVYNAGKEAPPRTVYSSIVVLARALRPVPPA